MKSKQERSKNPLYEGARTYFEVEYPPEALQTVIDNSTENFLPPFISGKPELRVTFFDEKPLLPNVLSSLATTPLLSEGATPISPRVELKAHQLLYEMYSSRIGIQLDQELLQRTEEMVLREVTLQLQMDPSNEGFYDGLEVLFGIEIPREQRIHFDPEINRLNHLLKLNPELNKIFFEWTISSAVRHEYLKMIRTIEGLHNIFMRGLRVLGGVGAAYAMVSGIVGQQSLALAYGLSLPVNTAELINTVGRHQPSEVQLQLLGDIVSHSNPIQAQ
jgi:hypothetical protein